MTDVASPLDIFAGDLRWVAWRNELRAGGGSTDKPTKIPYSPHGGRAKADDPSTWGDKSSAIARAKKLVNGLGGGVGIELGDLGGDLFLGGIDADSCLKIFDPGADAVIADWARPILQEVGTYTEISPSQTGAKSFFLVEPADVRWFLDRIGVPAEQWGCRRGIPGEDPRNHGAAIEIYLGFRYFAVTGNSLTREPRNVALLDRDALERLARLIPPPRGPGAGSKDRSKIAYAKGFEFCRLHPGCTWEEMAEALRRDAETAEWVREKGEAHGGRELKRIWDKATADDDESEDWGEPDLEVLRLHRRTPPPLPLELLGPWAEWITEAASAAACPVDYVMTPLLASASALIGHARWAQAAPGWSEPPHLWLCAVGDSGNGKSPGADCLMRDVLPEIERRMRGDFPDQLRDWQAASAYAKAAEERWKDEVRAAHKNHTPPPQPPADMTIAAEPQEPRLRQHDVTIERTASLLATAAPKGLLVVRDELAGWIAGMNVYNDAGRSFWIEAYGGRPYRVERQRNEPLQIPRLSVAVYGGTQPEKLAELMRQPDDGLLSRILWAWPEPIPFGLGRRTPRSDWATEALDRLRMLDLQSRDGAARPIIVALDEAGQVAIERFGREMQQLQLFAGGLMRSAYGKARGTALRLSLVLEYLWWCGIGGFAGPPSMISLDAFNTAAKLVADYFIPMAESVYGDAAASPADRNAATLARWIVKHRPQEVYVRELQRRVRLPGLSTADDIRAAANALVEAGWLKAPARSKWQQRARSAYAINPGLWDALDAAS